MKKFQLLIIVLSAILLSSCSYKLLPVETNAHSSLAGYKFFYVTPTAEVNSVSGSTYNGVGVTSSYSVNPADEIAGYFMNQGYIRLPQPPENRLDETLIINYGLAGRRKLSIFAYSTQITIQIIDAATLTPVVVSKAEGVGGTEADDIKIAIYRCMVELFK